MKKIKSISLLLLGGFLALFIYENWVKAPFIRIFGQDVIQLNISIIILTFFLVGFGVGNLSHYAWIQRRRKKMAAASGDQKTPESQDANQQEEKKQE